MARVAVPASLIEVFGSRQHGAHLDAVLPIWKLRVTPSKDFRRMKLDVSTVLPCTVDQAVSQVMTTRLLQYIAYPLVSFESLDAAPLPDTWSAGTQWVSLTLLRFIPLGRQAIVISMPPADRGFALRDAGYSSLIPVWDHLITIESVASGILYRDRVDVQARVLTPIIWLFAQIFYRHRQRRWRQLVARGFEYGDGRPSA